VDSKELSHQPFCSISRYRIPDFLAGSDAQPRGADLVWQSEARHESAAKADAAIVNLDELRPSAQFTSGVRPIFLNLHAHGDKGSDPVVTIRTTACVPWRACALGRSGHFLSASEQGIRVCGGDGADSVERSASSKFLRKMAKTAILEPTMLMARWSTVNEWSGMLQSPFRSSLMGFGLLPEFSTPVQKPVENSALRRPDRKICRVYALVLQAKAHRGGFEAVSA
jgi:hypothetical protein